MYMYDLILDEDYNEVKLRHLLWPSYPQKVLAFPD